MTPKFSSEIKALISKKPLDAEDIQPLKTALKKYAKEYLDLKKGGNSSINLTDIFINDIPVADANPTFIRDIGRQMERTQDYVMYEKENAGGYEIVVVPIDRPLWEKHSPWFTFGGIVLGAILTIFGAFIKSHIEKQTPQPIIKIDDSRIQMLNDSLKVFELKIKAMEDSFKKVSQN